MLLLDRNSQPDETTSENGQEHKTNSLVGGDMTSSVIRRLNNNCNAICSRPQRHAACNDRSQKPFLDAVMRLVHTTYKYKYQNRNVLFGSTEEIFPDLRPAILDEQICRTTKLLLEE